MRTFRWNTSDNRLSEETTIASRSAQLVLRTYGIRYLSFLDRRHIAEEEEPVSIRV
jgi:hypothetical protein